MDFERAAGFPSQDNRLPTVQSRPKELSEWFKIGRKTSGSGWINFCSGNPEEFGEGWKMWWSNMQASTHQQGIAGTSSKGASIDWGALQKPGASGMFLILVTLLWWRARLGEDSAADSPSLLRWKESVKDVTRVLGCLKSSYHEMGGKEGPGEISKEQGRVSRRKRK